MGSEYSWESLDSSAWRKALRRRNPLYQGGIQRIYPDTPDYDSVVLLRYESLVEGGILQPQVSKIETQQLDSDYESIILGYFLRGRLRATVSLLEMEEYVLLASGAYAVNRKGRRGMGLLLDTAKIISMGMSRRGLVGIAAAEVPLPPDFLPLGAPEAEALRNHRHLSGLLARYPGAGDLRLVVWRGEGDRESI